VAGAGAVRPALPAGRWRRPVGLGRGGGEMAMAAVAAPEGAGGSSGTCGWAGGGGASARKMAQGRR